MKDGARNWLGLALCMALALGLPGAALADPAPQPAGAHPGKQDYLNDDADLPPVKHNACGEDDAPPLPTVTYDYSAARISDYDVNNQVRAQGTDASHRLLVRGVIDDCGGLLLSHVTSRTPPPGGTETFDSIGLVAVGEAETFGGYIGVGGTFYSGLVNDQTFDVFVHFRKHVLYNLSFELNAAIPFVEMFSSNTDPQKGHNQIEIALRLDWKNVALRYGYRTYQVNAINRDGVFAGLTFKY